MGKRKMCMNTNKLLREGKGKEGMRKEGEGEVLHGPITQSMDSERSPHAAPPLVAGVAMSRVLELVPGKRGMTIYHAKKTTTPSAIQRGKLMRGEGPLPQLTLQVLHGDHVDGTQSCTRGEEGGDAMTTRRW